MSPSKLFLILLFLVSTDVAIGQSAVSDTDFQIWNETTFVLPVVKAKDEKGKSFDRLSLVFITSLRLGQNRLAPVDERIGGGLDVALNKHFNFSPTYLYVATQPVRGRSDFEHRIRFELTYNYKFEKFSIKDRNRIEYRVRNSHPDSVRYRNKFTFGVPIRRDGKELFAPFVADEPYYDFTAEKWTRNDLTTGIAKKFTEKLTGELFYVWRHNRIGSPVDVHAIGFNLKVKLK